MSILLSHNSSLERLRAVPTAFDPAKPVMEETDLDTLIPERYEATHLDFDLLGIAQQPIHHVVPVGERTSRSSLLCCHKSGIGKIGPGLVKKVTESVYACGPELTFAQMACSTSLVGAVVLGHEFCGRYSHFAKWASGYYERPPLTSVARIKEVLASVGKTSETEAALEALQWVRDGSASPMETVVSCMLNLPSSMGGFGKVVPALNYEVTLDEVAGRIAGKEKCYVDAAYADALCGMEFDGKDYHRDARADRIRRDALAHMGWTIYVVDVDDVVNWRVLKDKVALMNRVPQRQGETEGPDEALSRSLLERVLKATRFGVGPNELLFTVPVRKGAIKVHM